MSASLFHNWKHAQHSDPFLFSYEMHEIRERFFPREAQHVIESISEDVELLKIWMQKETTGVQDNKFTGPFFCSYNN